MGSGVIGHCSVSKTEDSTSCKDCCWVYDHGYKNSNPKAETKMIVYGTQCTCRVCASK